MVCTRCAAQLLSTRLAQVQGELHEQEADLASQSQSFEITRSFLATQVGTAATVCGGGASAAVACSIRTLHRNQWSQVLVVVSVPMLQALVTCQ